MSLSVSTFRLNFKLKKKQMLPSIIINFNNEKSAKNFFIETMKGPSELGIVAIKVNYNKTPYDLPADNLPTPESLIDNSDGIVDDLPF